MGKDEECRLPWESLDGSWYPTRGSGEGHQSDH